MAFRCRARWFRQPDGLSGEALRVWKTHAPSCCEAELLHEANAEEFKTLCRLLAAVRLAGAELERDGVTITTASGIKKSNPALNSLISAQRALEPLLSRFGMGG
jgi:P27 family predicted phage terminase small subunit